MSLPVASFLGLVTQVGVIVEPMCSVSLVAPLLVGLLACAGAADALMPSEAPRIDELGWLASVRARRPDLFREDCWNTMTLKPRYRAELLTGTDTYDALVARTYTPEQRAADLAWIRGSQDAERAFCDAHPGASGCDRICRAPCDACVSAVEPAPRESVTFPPSGYPLCGAVGYRVGEWPGTRYDTTGAIESWKVFFEFLDNERPSPAATDAFTQRLGERGFRGDWKMNATSEDPDMPRFQYNNLIVHAWSPADAEIAEAVGLELFSGHLAGHGRGLDVGTPPDARNATDWHHFLCEGDLTALPEEALVFVGFGTRPTLDLAPVEPATLRPLGEYHAEPIAGATVLWHPNFDADTALRERVAAALRADLEQVRERAPAALDGARIAVAACTPTIPALPGRGRQMGVHRSSRWLLANGFDAAREGVVEIYDAQDFLRARERSPDTLAGMLTVAFAVRSPERCAEVAAQLGTRCE